MPIEFILHSIYIAQATKMTDDESIMQCLMELMESKESKFLENYHWSIEKERQKYLEQLSLNTKYFVK